MPIVANTFRYVVGVDTHAATHSFAVIECPSGAVVDEATFPTTPAGLTRAREWIARRTGGDLDGVLVAAEGTGSYGSQLGGVLGEVGYRVVEAPTPRRGRGQAKTDRADALSAARSSLAMDITGLADRRSGDLHAALQVLVIAREQLTGERVRAVNALTALVRTHALDVDARRALTTAQLCTIAAWRSREEALPTRLARAQATGLARRIGDLDDALTENRTTINDLVTRHAPHLVALHGIGPITAAVTLTVWCQPGRVRSEAALAQIAGTCPIPASSGNTVRHRLNRGGDRRLNKAIHTIVLTRVRTDPTTRRYVERRRAEGRTDREIRRRLKRYVTRQIYRTLAAAPPTP